MIDAVVQAAREAGWLIQNHRLVARQSATTKQDASPVTDADRAADAFLRSSLLGVRRCAWLSEESADDLSRLDASELWLVDPLDGTREYIAGLPEYVVAVALVRQGTPVLGVVHNPATGATHLAEAGAGAFDGDGRRLQVAEGGALLVSRTEMRTGELEPFAREFRLHAHGSIQAKLALVAAGNASLTLSRGPKYEWDVCAGAVIVKEAGGIATDLFGSALRYNKSFPKVRGVLAGAPQAVARAARIVAVAGASPRMSEFDSITGDL